MVQLHVPQNKLPRSSLWGTCNCTDSTLLLVQERIRERYSAFGDYSRTIESAFKMLCNALDPPNDELEATARFRRMGWARGIRIEVFFALLWKEAKRAKFSNRQVLMRP